jgi:hypothetical protein
VGDVGGGSGDFIFFLVHHFFTFGDDCKDSLTPVARLCLDLD